MPGFGATLCVRACACVHIYRHRQLEHVQECSRVSVLATATYKSHSDTHVGPSCLQRIPGALYLTVRRGASRGTDSRLQVLNTWTDARV